MDYDQKPQVLHNLNLSVSFTKKNPTLFLNFRTI